MTWKESMHLARPMLSGLSRTSYASSTKAGSYWGGARRFGAALVFGEFGFGGVEGEGLLVEVESVSGLGSTSAPRSVSIPSSSRSTSESDVMFLIFLSSFDGLMDREKGGDIGAFLELLRRRVFWSSTSVPLLDDDDSTITPFFLDFFAINTIGK